ncbi:MAG: WhiB family transcriptional regulator [Acidimicrobiales bacterium]
MLDGSVNASNRAETWQERAKCKGASASVFYPLRGVPTASARALCKDCPVKPDCLSYALEHEEEFGIWGGLSERERRKLIRAQARLRSAGERRLFEAS